MVALNHVSCHWYHNREFFHYVLTKVHMTYLGKFVEITSEFNAVSRKTLTPKRRSIYWIPKARWMVRVFVPNFKVLYYFMEWIRILRRRRLCVMCEKKMNWYCSTYDNTMVYFVIYIYMIFFQLFKLHKY